MKKMILALFFFALLVVLGLFVFLYRQDKYTFMRYVDRYSYLLFRVTPFGGKPFEKFSENTYILGNYIYKKNNNSKSYIYSVVGTIKNIKVNNLTLMYRDSIAEVFLTDEVQIIVSVPETELPDKTKLLVGDVSMLEMGDSVICYVLADGKCNRLTLYKKFYDRNKFVN